MTDFPRMRGVREIKERKHTHSWREPPVLWTKFKYSALQKTQGERGGGLGWIFAQTNLREKLRLKKKNLNIDQTELGLRERT